MGLYNFQSRFVPFILDGRKRHTIRALRAYPDRPGKILHLYSGLRTKKAKLLMRVPCVKVEKIRIAYYVITVDGLQLNTSESEALARRDGFKNLDEMMRFWKDRLPFEGHIIYWRYDDKQPKSWRNGYQTRTGTAASAHAAAPAR